MANLSEFGSRYFFLVWVVFLLWTLLFFGRRWMIRKKRGSFFPEVPPEDILYHEKFASGRSFKNWRTRLGGARNCLVLTVTPDELWVTSYFPFSLLLEEYDGEHRVKRKNVTKIEETTTFFRKSFRISYDIKQGEIRTIELTPRDARRFSEALTKNGMMAKGGLE